MIKTLLLATSCVIGSGAGALQKNAPAFNHEKNAIINTSTENNETFTISSTEEYKNNKTLFYDYNATDDFVPYYAGKEYQITRFNNVATIEVMQTGQSHKWTYDEPENEYPVKNYIGIIKITPYLNYTNGTCNINLRFSMNKDPNNAVAYTNLDTRMEYWQSDDEQINQYMQSFPYGQLYYPTKLENILSNYTIYNYHYANFSEPSTNGVFRLYTSDRELYFETTQTITITNKPTYICFYTYLYDYSANEENVYDDIPYLQSATITLNRTIGVPTEFEVVDIGGIMFDILTMPFAFISRAFNLTLFPNTPYTINISRLFLGIFAALAFVFIIKKFIRK